MSTALEFRGVQKHFAVGVANCRVRADILRGVDFDVHEGESVAIVGPRGSGKSTLLLCAAGLLKPDSGEIRWYGESSLAFARQMVAYHWTPIDLSRSTAEHSPTDVRLHLLDFDIMRDSPPQIAEWVYARRMRGHSVVLATRDERAARVYCSRVLFLQHGFLTSFARSTNVARVAEPDPRPQ